MMHARRDYQHRIIDVDGLIPDEEPVFLLRGQDIIAPMLVEQWAREAQKRGASQAIVDAALDQVQAMLGWQRDHGAKVPDLPTKD